MSDEIFTHRAWSLLAFAVLCAAGSATAQPPGGAAPPPEVGVVTVASQDLPVAFEYLGVTEASKTVEIRSRIQGFIETRDFKEGQRVARGTLLFTIERPPFEADLEIAAAQVAQAESRLQLAKQEVARLQSVDDPAAISQSDLDTRLAEQRNAAAALRLTKAQLAKAELELSYTRISSPLDGFIGKALKEIGSLVDASQNSLLAQVWQVDPIYVSFHVTEREFLRLRMEAEAGSLSRENGDPPHVKVTLLNGETLPQQAEINFESAVVNVDTGSVEMRAEFANPGLLLKPGQFVTATLHGWIRRDVIAVPKRAVSQSPQGAYLYVVGPENKVEYRTVETGPWSGDRWIIESGLESGERVIVDGLVRVQPGIEVAPKPVQADEGAESSEPAAGQE